MDNILFVARVLEIDRQKLLEWDCIVLIERSDINRAQFHIASYVIAAAEETVDARQYIICLRHLSCAKPKLCIIHYTLFLFCNTDLVNDTAISILPPFC